MFSLWPHVTRSIVIKHDWKLKGSRCSNASELSTSVGGLNSSSVTLHSRTLGLTGNKFKDTLVFSKTLPCTVVASGKFEVEKFIPGRFLCAL
ncbi:MAG: hypothetical protein A4S09_11820 [Proteobacteria bacterium SG_bin7]|nr:MAG: hypothetical protein A4S09_11820 [Proteobacteria bacterium SG_bin7]